MNGYLNTNGVTSNGNVKNDNRFPVPSSKIGYINEKLPKEILLMIFGFLDITALCRCSQVCKFWYEIAFDGSNWKVINLFDFQIDITSNVVSKITEISARFLRELRMKGCIHINDKDIKSLAEQCPLIEELTLSECVNLTSESINSLTDNCENLTSLFIDSCTSISDDGVKKLGKCKGMMKLDLSFCDITDEALRSISQGCPHLTFLRVKGCSRVTGNGISEIAKSCPSLRLLNCNYVNDVSDSALALLARFCPELRTLCISHTSVTDAGLKALSGNLCAFTSSAVAAVSNNTALSSINTALTSTVISGPTYESESSSTSQYLTNPLTDSTTTNNNNNEQSVSSITAQSTSAAAAYNNNNNSGSTSTSKVLRQRNSHQQLGCRELIVLEVSGCRITDTGISHISGACTRLERLDLEDCGNITDESLSFLSMHCPRIRTLLLSHCDQITDAGVHRLVQDSNCNSSNGAPTAGSMHVSSGDDISQMGGCKQLEYLALDNCPQLTDAALNCLVRGCVQLKKIDLYDCQHITKQAIQRLQTFNQGLIIQSYFAPNTPEGVAGQRRRKVCRCCSIS